MPRWCAKKDKYVAKRNEKDNLGSEDKFIKDIELLKRNCVDMKMEMKILMSKKLRPKT